MKICITTTGDSLDSNMDPRFGRALYYLIYDLASDDFKVVDNQNVNVSGGAGTSAAQTMASENVTAVISGDFGPNATKGLDAFGIKRYKSKILPVKEVIDLYKKDKLAQLNGATVAGHNN